MSDEKRQSSGEFTEEQAREYAKYQATQDRGDPPHSPNGKEPHTSPAYPLTDSGNARRFTDTFGAAYRYDVTRKAWFHWTGIKWVEDVLNQAQEDAKQIALDIFNEGLNLPNNTPDFEKVQKAVFTWAKSSGMAPHIREMLRLAQSDKRLRVEAHVWDADPVLLGFPNGYLNLKTGEWRSPPWPEAMLTKVTAAPRDTAARDARWDATLGRFLPDAGVRRDFQKANGYCLGGRGKEHMFVPYGGTKRGKSTIIGAIREALGDYGGTADIESFTASHTQPGKGGTREDLVALLGRRLVVASEASERQRLSATTIKQVLGGSDKITMRALYGKQFDALPTFSLWLLTNELPKVSADDAAMWERIHVFEFNQYIPPEERDETERDKLLDPARSGSAILAWLEEGWWAYMEDMKAKRGLYLPTTVAATEGYRAGQDHIAQFIADGCVVGDKLFCRVDTFKSEFRQWLEDEHIREQYSDIRIGKALEARGYTAFTHGKLNARCRQGLHVRGIPEGTL